MANYVSHQTAAEVAVSALFKSVYMQMAAALSITGLVAYFLSQSIDFWYFLAENSSMIWIIFIAQIGLVV
jgi:FtsH-binding integral membrane protein